MQRGEKSRLTYIWTCYEEGTKLGAKCTLHTVRMWSRVMVAAHMRDRLTHNDCEEVNQADQASQHPWPVCLFKVCLTLSTYHEEKAVFHGNVSGS